MRDLPQSAKDIPAKYKKETWASLGINVENNFEPLYVNTRGKSKIIKELKEAMGKSDMLILATDEDREGESISWHLHTLLKPKIPVKRMVFHEITERAIKEALHNFRDIDMQLVKAQETRRILDRLFGYTLSPLIWKKIAFGLSAGRVQSPGLRMLVEQERARILHVSTTYWDLLAQVVHPDSKEPFEARLAEVDGMRMVGSKDFDSVTGARKNNKTRLLQRDECTSLMDALRGTQWTVEAVTEKESKVHPQIPFITATLQQTANRRLRFSSKETMRVAQHLYESGKITYMRTDSPHLSQEATNSAREAVQKAAGAEFLSEKVRYFKSGKGEAHEAIRPAGVHFLSPKESGLSGRELSLYTMIWQRTLATQMKPAIKSSMKVTLRALNTCFEATGSRVVFPGFLKVYGNEGLSDTILPTMHKNDTCSVHDIKIEEHSTRPPARFSEATLIQKLEEKGIGRPSTYASIISTLYDRDYVRHKNNALVPTFTGIAVIQLLEDHFTQYIDYTFTSDMERVLDEIATGAQDNLSYLERFYRGSDGIAVMVKNKEHAIGADVMRVIRLPHIDKRYEMRIGRYGPYIICKGKDESVHVSIPDDVAPADVTVDTIDEWVKNQEQGPTSITQDPESGKSIYLRTGRYGPYLQIGENDDDPKPKRASVPPEYRTETITPEIALMLLSLPRVLGQHPESGKDVCANRGRFGPYIMHDGDTRSLTKGDNVYTITHARALTLLAVPKVRSSRTSLRMIRELGTNKKKQSISLYNGRYGPYLKVGKKNIALPKEMHTPEMLEKLDMKAIEDIIN